jgi:hypothetical protein
VTLDSFDSPQPGLGETTTFPHIVHFVPLHGTHIRMAFYPRTPKEESQNCPDLDFCEVIILCSDLRLGWIPKQTCSSPRELSNSVSYSTCTHPGWVDSQLLVVESQTASLTLDLSFCRNLCYRCPNGPCEPIFDIYTLLVFQWHKETPMRGFDPCNRTLKFRESWKTPKSQFWECEFHLHTPSK